MLCMYSYCMMGCAVYILHKVYYVVPPGSSGIKLKCVQMRDCGLSRQHRTTTTTTTIPGMSGMQ